ncbi:FAD-binding oxidoreductase [Bordetella genomosp. 2]|uniref:FAD-binding oxidoreductase n=1 Tax=Bordetella genomosp. 2 TaxID=1983456 RepID=A0A261VZ26_9BORD|nr:FAD-binding oxidoreductase [Bordetella genomosp. 2]OZI79037.1 FAD-binding oxidoreductase [Bordetella genomosp. 2]
MSLPAALPEAERDIDARFFADWSGMVRGVPGALYRPRSVEEVSAILRHCHQQALPVTIQGGLTGLAGGGVPADGDVVVNLERMAQIEHIDELEGIMTVQAGATLQAVQEAASRAGWYFPVDFGARGSCQVGGNAATNAGGERVIRYGTMRDSVLGLEAVLADGTVLSSLTRLVKNSAGLDLRFLFIGSEGTLGIITRLRLKLQPMPASAAAAFAAASDMHALACLLRDLKRAPGVNLTAFEFMSGEFVAAASRLAGRSCPLDGRYPWYVLIESAEHAESGGALQRALERALESGRIADCAVSASLADTDAFWQLRHSIPELLAGLKPTVNFDCGLPWAEMEGFVDRVNAAMRARYPDAAHLFFGHLGDNNIHLMSGPHRVEDLHAVEAQVYAQLRGREGTISAEHGIGFIKKPFLGYTRSAAELDVLRRLKAALDPRNILNPGRVLD